MTAVKPRQGRGLHVFTRLGVETMTTIELHYAYPTSGIDMAAAAVASPLGIGASNAARFC